MGAGWAGDREEEERARGQQDAKRETSLRWEERTEGGRAARGNGAWARKDRQGVSGRGEEGPQAGKVPVGLSQFKVLESFPFFSEICCKWTLVISESQKAVWTISTGLQIN